MPIDKAKLALAAITSIVALALPLKFVSTETAIEFVKHQGYLAMCATLLLFLAALWPELKKLRGRKIHKESVKTHLSGLILILLGTVFLHLHEEPSFKILFDEHVLSSTAKNLHENQTAYAQSAGHIISEDLRPSIGFVDKRPLLFPFTLSLVHNLLGYDVNNVFWLNTALTVLLLLLLYHISGRFCGPGHGVLAVLLFLGLPLLAQNTNGGGYELLNLCLIAALVLAGIRYLQNESPRGGLNLLIMTAILLANVRYESALYVLVPAALFLIKSIRTKSLRLTWMSAASPLLLILPLLNYAIFQREPRFIQTTKENFFSLIHLPGNLSHAIGYLFDAEYLYTNSLLLSLCGAVAIIVVLLRVARRPTEHLLKSKGVTVILVVFSIVSLNTFLALICYWGEWTDPLTSRFSLPLQWFMAVFATIAIKEYFNSQIPLLILIVFAGVQLTLVTPLHNLRMATEARMPNSIGYQWALDWADTSAPQGNHLYLAPSSIGFGLTKNAAIPFKAANSMPERVLLLKELGIYNQIFAFEVLVQNEDGAFAPSPKSVALNSRYVLDTIEELDLKNKIRYRISRVTGLSASTHGNETLPQDLPQMRTPGKSLNELTETDLYKLLPLAP